MHYLTFLNVFISDISKKFLLVIRNIKICKTMMKDIRLCDIKCYTVQFIYLSLLKFDCLFFIFPYFYCCFILIFTLFVIMMLLAWFISYLDNLKNPYLDCHSLCNRPSYSIKVLSINCFLFLGNSNYGLGNPSFILSFLNRIFVF